jgi:glutamine amidotransferase
MAKIAVIDYGMGNLFSITRALEHLGAGAVLTSDPQVLLNAQQAILPGVGAFGQAMQELRERGLVEAIHEFVGQGKPLLGICLGMQLLMSESSEFGDHQGLGLVPGKVVRFKDPQPDGPQYKIPQIGWNQVEVPEQATKQGVIADEYWQGSVLAGTSVGAYYYFVHSYVCVPNQQTWIIGETFYGRERFCSVMQKENVIGCQFHPERSAETGLHIYKNFLELS